MTFLDEAEAEEKGDVYLICDGNLILYISRSLQLALRFYKNLTNKSAIKNQRGPIVQYKEEHPTAELTAVKIFQDGTSPVKSALTEALVIQLANELGMKKLAVTDNGEEQILTYDLRNKKKERLPPHLKQKLEDPRERKVILNGLKGLIRKAMADDKSRVTVKDATHAWKLYNQERLSDGDFKARKLELDLGY
jgi:hypothetical protein